MKKNTNPRVLLVIDMQNDFINGALGTKEAEAIVSNVNEKIAAYRSSGDVVVFTRDTHYDNYLETAEGKKLPVPHCIEGTFGWHITPNITVHDMEAIHDKHSFGSIELANYVKFFNPSSIELIGLCTDICVISNAMIMKARFPEIPIIVDSACCAGVTPESHENALKAMALCQIDIL